MTTVTLLTRDATLDDLSAQDYADMFAEVRGRMAPGKLVKLYGDPEWDAKTTENYRQYFFRYDKGEMTTPMREMRNVLRRAMGMPVLPPTVADAVAAGTSPDAAVWSIGDGPAEHVILVTGAHDMMLHINGAVTVQDAAQIATQPAVAAPARLRTPVARPVASKAQDARREALQVRWQDVIEAGLKALEGGQP